MKLCNDTITVFNAKFDPATGADRYIPTVITGVSWRKHTLTAVNEGLVAADQLTLRIPVEADAGGRRYTTPAEYAAAADVSEMWTLKAGDIVAHDAIDAPGLKPSGIKALAETSTIVGVTDNSRAPHAPHWRVVGK